MVKVNEGYQKNTLVNAGVSILTEIVQLDSAIFAVKATIQLNGNLCTAHSEGFEPFRTESIPRLEEQAIDRALHLAEKMGLQAKLLSGDE